MTRALQKAVEDYSPAIVLGAASAIGRDAFARLSARTKSGLGAEITEMRIEEGALIAIRPQFSGKCSHRCRFQRNASCLQSVQAHLLFHLQLMQWLK